MREKAAILDLAEPVRGNETTGSGAVSVETPGGADLVMIGTTEDIVAGSVLIKSSLRLPESVHFASRQYGSWKILAGIDGFARRAQVVRSRLEFLLYGAGDQAFCPVFEPQQSTKEGAQEDRKHD